MGPRHPVRDLTDTDFTVLLDGVPRRILAFTTDEVEEQVARGAAWQRDVAPDVAANSLANPRLVVIILDNGLLPGDPWILKTAKSIGVKVVDQLAPGDLAAIVFTSDNRAPQDFTADRQRLHATIDRLNYGFEPRVAVERRDAQLRSFDTLKQAIQFLSGVPELRSLIVWVTVGWPDPLQQRAPKFAGLGTADLPDTEAALSLATGLGSGLAGARVSGVPVYAVSPLGLVPDMPMIANPQIFGAVRIGAGGISAREALFSADFRRGVSETTGGRAIALTNAPAERVPEVFRENSVHYTLAYEAPKAFADGRYHRIEVRVNREGAIVQPDGARMFLSSKPAAGVPIPETTRALSGLVPLAGEPLRLAIAAVATPPTAAAPGAAASLVLALGVDAPASLSGAGDQIAVKLRVFDGEGRRQIDLKKMGFRVPPTSSGRDRSLAPINGY